MRLTLAIGVVWLLGLAVPAQEAVGGEESPAGTPALESSREILLTFKDRGLARTTNAGPGRYFRRSGNYQTTTWSRSIAAEIARDYGLATLLQWPIRALSVHCVVYRVDDTRSVASVIAQLQGDSRVKSVQPMNRFHTLGNEDPYRPLQTSFNDMQVEALHGWATGMGVNVAIIDAGVDGGHPDLDGQVAQQLDLTDSALDLEDDIHGTAVAGIIAALSENGLGIAGIAPDARLIALRACWPERAGAMVAVCNSLTLARALDNAISLKPEIVNMSLTGPQDPLIQELLRSALSAGIVVVAAQPQASPPPVFTDGIDDIIRVQSGARLGAGTAPRDTSPIIFAPGRDVLTTFPNGTYNFVTGSSFAAANVSGIIALLLELQPELSSRDIQELFFLGTLGADETDGKNPVSTTFDMCRVVAQLRADFVCGSSAPANQLVQASP